MGTGDTALCPLPGGPGWPGGRGPSPYPEDGSAICELADGAEAGPRLSGQGPGIPFAPWKLPAYEEARATVSREVCSNERYLLGYRQFWSPCSLPSLDWGDAGESDSLPGRCQGKSYHWLLRAWGSAGETQALWERGRSTRPRQAGSGKAPWRGCCLS